MQMESNVSENVEVAEELQELSGKRALDRPRATDMRPSSASSASSLAEAQSRGWLNRLSGVYSAAEKHLAKGARALHKFAVPLTAAEELQIAKAQLEDTASSVRGAERHQRLKEWLDMLSEPADKTSRPLIVAEPASPASSEGDVDGEWQQLSALPASSSRFSSDPGHVAAEMHVAGQVFTTSGFRSLFLRSKAFQYLIEGYASEPPENEEESQLLAQLVTICCTHCSHTEDLLKAVYVVAERWKQCETVGVDGDALRDVAKCAADALHGLQSLIEVEEIDSKLEMLKEEIAEQAATAALVHKFNHGSQQPTKDVTRNKLTQGLAATQQIMVLVEALCRLAESKVRVLTAPRTSRYSELTEQLQKRSQLLATNASLADIEMSENLRQQQESIEFRERKSGEMVASLETVQDEIRELQIERAALLAKLEKVELSLARAQARKADAEESKIMFEEGSNFTIHALGQQAGQLSKQQKQCQSETRALEACQELLQQTESAYVLQSKTAKEFAMAAVVTAAQEYTHAATRHLYFLRAILQLLLQQLTFCHTELQESEKRQKRALKLGMQHLLADAAVQKHRLMQQYIEIESALLRHQDEVETTYEKSQKMSEMATSFLQSQQSVEISTEMGEVFESIAQLKETFENLQRPSSLPALGDDLDDLELQETLQMSSSSSFREEQDEQGAAGEISETEAEAEVVPMIQSADHDSIQALAEKQTDPAETGCDLSEAVNHDDLGLEDLLEPGNETGDLKDTQSSLLTKQPLETGA